MMLMHLRFAKRNTRLLHRATFVLAPLVGILALAGTVESRTWHVHQDGSGDAPTIQAAVDSARTGDSILVAAGTYTQDHILVMNKDSITIKSEQGPSRTVLHTLDGNILVVESSRHVRIDEFTFEDSPSTALGAAYVEDLVLEGNVVRNTSECGILITSRSANVIIRENLIYSNNGDGVGCTDYSDNIYIYGNTISHNVKGNGIFLDDVAYNIVNNVITYNRIGVQAFQASFSCNDAYGNGTNYALLFVPDPTGVNGNISMPPLFCGVDPATSGNYYLQQNSPCAPGNHPEGPICGVIGRYGIGCKDTAVNPAPWGKIKSLFGR
jgi:hypothetical protein